MKECIERSIRTSEEVLKLVQKDLSMLTPEEREVMEILIREMKTGKSGLLELMSEMEYQEPMVDMETWLSDPYYFGKAHNLWPKLRDDLIELFSGDYHEVILSGSLGYGKSYLAKVALCRVFYELSCLKDPQKSFGLAPNSLINISAISVSAKVARKVLFEDLQGMLQLSPYFMERFKPHMTQEEIRFPNKIWASPLSATPNAAIGANVVSSILDETIKLIIN